MVVAAAAEEVVVVVEVAMAAVEMATMDLAMMVSLNHYLGVIGHVLMCSKQSVVMR